jgi:hypothetical protein
MDGLDAPEHMAPDVIIGNEFWWKLDRLLSGYVLSELTGAIARSVEPVGRFEAIAGYDEGAWFDHQSASTASDP